MSFIVFSPSVDPFGQTMNIYIMINKLETVAFLDVYEIKVELQLTHDVIIMYNNQ